MPEGDSGGMVADAGTRTDTSGGTSTVGGPTDSTGIPIDQLYDEAEGDTSELPSRVKDLEMTQTALQEYVTELNRRHKSIEQRVTDAEKENDAISSLSERVTELEDQVTSMEQTRQNSEMGLSGSYPSFAAFSLRATVAALLFTILFAMFYTQGLIGGLAFGGVAALLILVGVGFGLTWYQLKTDG